MIKRIFTLNEDFDGTLAGKVEEFNKDGARVDSQTVNLSEFPNNIVESFFPLNAPAEEEKGEGEPSLGESIQKEMKDARKQIKEKASGGKKDGKEKKDKKGKDEGTAPPTDPPTE